MPAKKLSPRRSSKKEEKEQTHQAKKYGGMSLYTLLFLTAVASAVLFIIYAAESDAKYTSLGDALDDQERDYGRMEITAYATIIALLFCILMVCGYIAYMVHQHSY